MSAVNGTPLRFAALVRVSTERQEDRGESLHAQRAGIAQAVDRLGGVVAAWYGGQEHATEGWERKEIVRLAADAARGKFEAVVVHRNDRWDRGSEEARQALKDFKRLGVRFFSGTTEYVLGNPDHELILGMSAVVGKFLADSQKKASLLSRIHRARRGLPTVGKRPFGRAWDAKKGVWVIDEEAKRKIAEIANRYLAGESLPRLADEYGLNHANLCKTLRERCGTEWVLEFDADDLNIHERVTLTVPELLPEKMIKALRQHLTANRTFLHPAPRPVHEYLLNGLIFCGACGYAMFGRTNEGRRYYRHHASSARRMRPCPARPRPLVPADRIEKEVVRDLFNMVGNPAAVVRAVKDAAPDCERAVKRRTRLEADLGKVEKARGRVIDAIADGLLSKGQAKAKLDGLAEQEALLRGELDKVEAELADQPDPEAIRRYVERIGDAIRVVDPDYPDASCNGGNDLGGWLAMHSSPNCREDKRRLIDACFAAPLADGTPAGVYVRSEGAPFRPKRCTYTIRGRLEFELVMRNAYRRTSLSTSRRA